MTVQVAHSRTAVSGLQASAADRHSTHGWTRPSLRQIPGTTDVEGTLTIICLNILILQVERLRLREIK